MRSGSSRAAATRTRRGTAAKPSLRTCARASRSSKRGCRLSEAPPALSISRPVPHERPFPTTNRVRSRRCRSDRGAVMCGSLCRLRTEPTAGTTATTTRSGVRLRVVRATSARTRSGRTRDCVSCSRTSSRSRTVSSGFCSSKPPPPRRYVRLGCRVASGYSTVGEVNRVSVMGTAL